MKAFEYTRYGSADVLRLVDAGVPVPADDEVLLRVHAASVNALDWRLMRGKPAFARIMAGGIRRPKPTQPGRDVAGTVQAVGRAVTRFRPGDAVFGVCAGAMAEYACARESRIVHKPANVAFESAAAVPVAGSTALQGLRDAARVQPGHTVLIDGASGGVGTFAVQIARCLGAEVTAACSTRNVDAARAMGAGVVIDYTCEDFTGLGGRFNCIFAANAHHSIFDYRRMLTPDGIYVIAGGGGVELVSGMALGPLLSLLGRRTFRFVMARITREDLEVLAGWLASAQLVPAIERLYAFGEAPDAIRYVEDGHARGKVVVLMDAPGEP